MPRRIADFHSMHNESTSTKEWQSGAKTGVYVPGTVGDPNLSPSAAYLTPTLILLSFSFISVLRR